MSAPNHLEQAEPAALVVFGLDDSDKAHASTFTASEAELATKAAALMGMRAMPVETDVQRALAAKLPQGRIFASGKGFVPYVKTSLYAELEAAAPAETGEPERTADKSTVAKAVEQGSGSPGADQAAVLDDLPNVAQPSDWTGIEVGTIVLGAALTDQGWYECVVVSVDSEDLLQLRYCDFPREPTFKAHRSEIGLMHPSHVPEARLPAMPSAAAAA